MRESTRALELRDVEKRYGALRPLRVRNLTVDRGARSTLIGLDLPAAETLINLITGAVLPDAGTVLTLGRSTAAIVDSDEWLKFVEQFGFVSDRAALLDAMTILQNLAIPFSLEIDPVPMEILPRAERLADEVDIPRSALDTPAGEATLSLRARVRLARALALDPLVLVLEHPTAQLNPQESAAYAAAVHRIWQRRELTVVAISMDDRFASALGGRALVWQPATGAFKPRRRWF